MHNTACFFSTADLGRCVYVCVCLFVCVYVCVFRQGERGRGMCVYVCVGTREGGGSGMFMCVCVCQAKHNIVGLLLDRHT
jgi:hypothetical protein